MIQYLPHNFIPRHYQSDLLKAFFIDKYKRLVCLWHRRAGKDAICNNLMLAAAFDRVGNYYYLFPELKQARRDIWEGIGADGDRFLDCYPAHLIKKKNNSEMTIELINGSIIRFCGSDRYDALMGSNPVGIIFSEYSLQKPSVWDYMRPILAENKGWALFQFTPRGMNHAYEFFEAVGTNEDWYVNTTTVETSKRGDGTPVITQEMIEEERKAGMSDEMIQQEFYCSFTAAVKGAYFAKSLRAAREDGRICDFGIDTQIPVETYWDLGHSDKTAIWWVQRHLNLIKCINYYEMNLEDLKHYIYILDNFRTKNRIVYKDHFAPHDAAHKTLAGAGKSIQQQARELGLHLKIVPRISEKMAAIEMARSLFPRVWIHETNCKPGIACLMEYHSEYDEKNKILHSKPKHNWASHGADAFMAIAQQFRQENPYKGGPVTGKFNSGPL